MILPGGGTPPGAQGRLQLAVDPLHHAIGLGMVGSGGDVLDPLLLTPVRPRAGGELVPLLVVMRAGMPKSATHMVMKASSWTAASGGGPRTLWRLLRRRRELGWSAGAELVNGRME